MGGAQNSREGCSARNALLHADDYHTYPPLRPQPVQPASRYGKRASAGSDEDVPRSHWRAHVPLSLGLRRWWARQQGAESACSRFDGGSVCFTISVEGALTCT